MTGSLGCREAVLPVLVYRRIRQRPFERGQALTDGVLMCIRWKQGDSDASLLSCSAETFLQYHGDVTGVGKVEVDLVVWPAAGSSTVTTRLRQKRCCVRS